MSTQEYKALVDSLATREVIDVNGVPVEVRNCSDRIPGRMDPRTAKTAWATRESFRADKGSFDPALWGNEEKLFGPEHPECYADPLAMMRFQFGWHSADKSEGVSTKPVHLENRQGPFTVWQYEPITRSKNRSCLIFIHGGGFAAGNTETVENQCKLIAQLSGGVVLSVDYPLAPEKQYPAGLDACYDTVKWAWENAAALGVSRDKIGVSGDSAGGNLSLACALRDREERAGRIRYQALIYPLLARSFGPADPHYYWSEEQFDNPENDPEIARQIRLIGKDGKQNSDWYLPEGMDRFHPEVSPITGGCQGLPKTLIMTAEYDYLRAECDVYLGMLKRAGVDARGIRYGGIFHGTFDRLGYAPQVEDMIREIAKDLKGL